MDHLYPDMLKVNDRDDITRWWELIDRTTGEVVPASQWTYDGETGNVTIHGAKAFHDYTVSFLAYIMWDPVHMYNAVTNGWTNFEKQITLMCASRKPTNIPWSVCGNLSRTTRMWT